MYKGNPGSNVARSSNKRCLNKKCLTPASREEFELWWWQVEFAFDVPNGLVRIVKMP